MKHRRIPALALGVVVVLGATFLAFRVRTPDTRSIAGRLSRHVAAADLNLLLVTLDTTRADRLGAYGSSARATPAFDRIAAEGVLFQRAVTAVPLTLPSHATIFTGRYPPAHGVRDNGGFFLDARETTLAERLKARGFKTGGFVGAYVLDRRWGIAQGFDTYFDEFDLKRASAFAAVAGGNEVERPANEVVDRALAWLEQAGSSRFFAWTHLYDAHSPYDPPEPFRSRFAGDAYEGEIAFADAQIARLIAFLERRGLLEKTIVAVIGDHGESLGEHGERTHGFFVYQSVLGVPFAIRAPFDRLRGRKVADVVRSVDVVPTLMELLSIPLTDRVDGRSLLPLMAGEVRELGLDAYAEAMYPQYHFGWSELRAVISGRFKYIEAPRPELYDLEQDPGEAHNLYESRRPLADRMAASLNGLAVTPAQAATPAVEVDPETRARLAALGYVGTFVSDRSPSHTALADPKDKIDLFNLITSAREEFQERRDPKAGLAMLEEAVRKDPEIVDAWLLMGNEHARRRRFDRALECFRRALALKPDYDVAVMNMANVYRDLGRDGDAVVGLKRLLDVNPNNAPARLQLGQILFDQGQVADAEREFRRALADRPDLPFAHFNLALAAERRGDQSAAEAEYLKEIELHPGSYMAQFNLGKLYEQRGNREAQLRAYEASVASNPQFAEGHLFLAKLYFDLGRQDEAVASARRGLDAQPEGEWSPLGHFVLADVLTARGERAAAAREMTEGRRLASRRPARTATNR